MSVSVTGEPVVKKKQVRFARMGEDDDGDNNEDQEEDTLFDKRKDTRRGLRSVIKGGKRLPNPDEFDKVEIISRGRSTSTFGAWMITLVLCASFLGLGMCISVLGPTFQDLAINVNKNISNISYIFVGRSAGYIGGSVLAGILFDIMNHHLLLGFTMLVTAFGMFAVPFCKKAYLLTALMSCVGLSMGFLDTGGNVLILNTWGDQAGPHMQALHFSFAAGAFVSPIIAKLLFGNGNNHDSRNNTSEEAADVSTSASDQASKTLNSYFQFTHSRSGTLKSMWAYIVIGAFVLLVSLLFFLLYSCRSPARDRGSAPSGKPLVAKHHKTLIFLLSVFFFWYVGTEVAYGSFIFTYAKDYARMDQVQAAWLNSLFWGTFATARGLAIFFAACMHPGTMILVSLVGCTLSSLLLVLFSRAPAALWSCTALYGAAMATTFPSGISWVEQYTVVTGRTAAVFVVGAAMGEMVLPALLGFLLGRTQEQPLLMYLTLGTSIITSILFPVMYKLASSPSGPGRRLHERGRSESDSEDRRALLLNAGGGNEDEGEQEEDEDEEADQWNDADFEVIEMDDASLVNSPNKALSPPDVAGTPGSTPGPCMPAAPSVTAPTAATEPSGLPLLSDSPVSFLGDSPRRKLLSVLDREKRD